MKIPTLHLRSTALEVRSENLPDGVCGIVTGIAVRYNVTDSWGTRFRPGAFDKTRAKVASRKVKFFANHGAGDSYGIRTHIGTVTSLVLAGDAEVFTAELFDTEEGRHSKAYLEAVQKSRAETGASVGFNPREGEWMAEGDNKYSYYDFIEVELEEISLAPRQAVPGAVITGVRAKPALDDVRLVLRGLREMMGEAELLALVRENDSTATDGDEPGRAATRGAAPEAPAAPPDKPDADDESAGHRSALASMADRMAAFRSTFTHAPRG
ncbi:MAG: HK97 family phage prohead protease [Gemmatimonadota bacterium]